MEDVYENFIVIDNLYIFNEVYLDIFYVLLLLKVFSVVYIFMDMNLVFKKNVRV